MFTDSELETSMGFEFPFAPLNKNECLISSKLAKSQKIKLNSTFSFNMFDTFLFDNLKDEFVDDHTVFNNEKMSIIDNGFIMSCKLVGTFNQTYGRFEKSMQNKVILMEYKYLFESMADSLINHIDDYKFYPEIKHIDLEYENSHKEIAILKQFIEFVKTRNPYDHAYELIFNFPSPRLDYYSSSDLNSLNHKAVMLMEDISDKLGFFPTLISMPIMTQMQQYNLAILFLSLIFSMILALFVTISIILTHSLLLIDVQRRVFEIGLRRMVGETQSQIIKSVIIRAFTFALPGTILGFLLIIP